MEKKMAGMQGRTKRRPVTKLVITSENVDRVAAEALANLQSAAGRVGQDRAIKALRAVAKFRKESGTLPEPTAGRAAVGLEGESPTKDRIKSPAVRVGGRAGLAPTQVTYLEGKRLQTRVFRDLKKQMPNFSSLPVSERVRLNLKALGSIPAELVPGVISQMGTHYFTNDRVLGSSSGQTAVSAIEAQFGKVVSGKVETILAGGVSERREMGGGNTYGEDGTVTERSGKTRKETLAAKRNVPTPKGGSKTKRSRAGMDQGGELRRDAYDNIAPRGIVMEDAEAVAQEMREKAKTAKTPAERFAYEQAAIAIETQNAERSASKSITIDTDPGSTRRTGEESTAKVKVGGQRELSAGMERLSRTGDRQNRETLVALAIEQIKKYREKYGMPPSGWAPVLKAADPLFGNMSDSELRRIAKAARTELKQARVERSNAKPAAPSRGRVELSPSGADVTGQTPKRKGRRKKTVTTRSGLTETITVEPTGKNQAAIAQAEADYARDRFKGTDARKKERKTAAIKGEAVELPKPAQEPRGTSAVAADLKKVTTGGEGSPRLTRRKSVGSNMKVGKLSSEAKKTRDAAIFAAIEASNKAGGKKAARTTADALKATKPLRRRAKAAGLLGIATTFGTNYILSLLEEEKKGRR